MSELRGELIEGIITESEDESLMDRYLSGEDIDPKVLIEDLEKAVARGSFYPVLATSAPQKIGMLELLEIMTQAFPSPAEHPMPELSARLDGKPITGPGQRSQGPAARRGHPDHLRPLRRPDRAWSACSARCARDASGARVRPRPRRRRHEDHDNDERVGAVDLAAGQAAA